MKVLYLYYINLYYYYIYFFFPFNRSIYTQCIVKYAELNSQYNHEYEDAISVRKINNINKNIKIIILKLNYINI